MMRKREMSIKRIRTYSLIFVFAISIITITILYSPRQIGLCRQTHEQVNISPSATWEELTDQAFEYYKEKMCAEATYVTERALQIAEQTYGNESIEVTKSMDNLAALYRIQGECEKAETLSIEAKNIKLKNMRPSGISLGLASEIFFDTHGKGGYIPLCPSG
jgi:hypothetical protein